MVETDSEVMSQLREEHQQHEHIIHNESTSSSSLPQSSKNNQQHQILQSLGRQPSIYSLTLDEFQNTFCENNVGNKNFNSMNMDEFLNSIWTAEEAEAQAQAQPNNKSAAGAIHNPVHGNNHFPSANSAGGDDKGNIIRQPSLPRQASLAIPEPFCRKTVEEVWSEISKNHHHQQRQDRGTTDQGGRARQRQPTLGSMTLEDFLVRAGIVRERKYVVAPPPHQPPAQPQHVAYGMYQNAAAAPSAGVGVGPSFVARPMMVVSPNIASYQQAIQPGINVGDSSSNYGMKRVVGGGGFGQVMMGSPVSPVSSDGISGNHHHHHQQRLVDGGVGNQQAAGGGGGGGGRKRILDGPVEKVVERRQRRMIKNRESAARSRARKQAYTVELEAELNQLKEENARLRQALVELERRRKQQKQYYEDARAKAHFQQAKAYKVKDKLRRMRRCLSAPL